MPTYTYSFPIKAETREDADRLAGALTQIYLGFTRDELIAFGDKMKSSPGSIRSIMNNPIVKSLWKR